MCEHTDGFFMTETIVINPDRDNDCLEAVFVCNHLGCSDRKKLRFDITNIKEMKQ